MIVEGWIHRKVLLEIQSLCPYWGDKVISEKKVQIYEGNQIYYANL
jgi:hypothetical protein